jgi:DNA-binding GntR family transcriptional regulator
MPSRRGEPSSRGCCARPRGSSRASRCRAWCAAIEAADPATRAFLLADFHVCLAECLGHKLLSDMLRDLTARTTLVASLYQSTHDARQSCTDHEQIVSAIEQGQLAQASTLMLEHIGNVEDALGQSAAESADARDRLRTTLAPLRVVR